jgi:hypothetical protein
LCFIGFSKAALNAYLQVDWVYTDVSYGIPSGN